MIKSLTAAMKSLIERMSRKLVNKLNLLFTSIIILIVGSLTVISYQMLQKESVSNSMASTTNNLMLVNQKLEDYLDGIEQFSLPHNKYDEIIRAVMQEGNDYAARMYLEDYLRDLFYSRKDLESIYLYLIDQQKYYSISREAYNITVRSGYQGGIDEQPWYKEAMNSPQNRSFQSFVLPDATSGYTMITEPEFMGYHRVLRSIASREPRAVLSFYLKPTVKDSIISDIPFEEGEHLMYLDPDNVPFHMDDLEVYEAISSADWFQNIGDDSGSPVTWSDGDKRYLVVYDVGQQDGWKLIKPIPYSSIYEAATKARNLSYLIGFIFLVISVILVTLTSNAITRPLNRLSRHMRRFSEGTFDAEAPVQGNDEIAYLTMHFNQMVRRTNDLINERYRMKLVEKNAILKALEAEINPHFLYNALQAISTKALKSGNDDVADMVDALALTLRYCISGKDIVYAREELKHIERYLALQSARFGSRLRVNIEWDESLMELQIPKLSIQSLVENSIKHAVEKVSTPVTIVVRATVSESHAIISVYDDGPGISPDRLEQILHTFEVEWEEQEGENIGLKNLNTRLKLLYGDPSGLAIHSDGSGTEMTMRIPRGGVGHV
ncbi:sensor histidine kinase [Paenibacillus woosongensis]|uniref:histidine kinase n=1 Tax=Paenibacillus woosongensis TaxID=307580 RepID=A0AA95L0V9_9BACL|nr:sensor histidine kinase [Paenibacillus woosongensis]WHX48894.1 sensor histidine kinase [Paenibacillus woosongensis]